MENTNVKELLADMIYDQPREKVVEAMNIIHSLYDICSYVVYSTPYEKTAEGYEKHYNYLYKKYNIKNCCPIDILEKYGFSAKDFDNSWSSPFRYLKNQFKFLSRKLAWIDKGMQK